MILICLLFFYVELAVAGETYVHVLLQFNQHVAPEKIIPGVLEDNVVSATVIRHYVNQLTNFLVHNDAQHYTGTVKILEEYFKYGNNTNLFPLEHSEHFFKTDDLAKVDFFLKRLCHSFEDNYWPQESFVFYFLMYRHRYEKKSIETTQIIVEKNQLKLECEKRIAEHEISMAHTNAEINKRDRLIEEAVKKGVKVTKELENCKQQCSSLQNTVDSRTAFIKNMQETHKIDIENLNSSQIAIKNSLDTEKRSMNFLKENHEKTINAFARREKIYWALLVIAGCYCLYKR